METNYSLHITDPPIFILDEDNAVLRFPPETITVKCVGSATGRFLFKTWSPVVSVRANNVTIEGARLRWNTT